MAQITIYLDNEHEQRLRKAADDDGVPVSRWVASLIEEHTRSEWPTEVRESAGSWPEAPSSETLRGNAGSDIPRESL